MINYIKKYWLYVTVILAIAAGISWTKDTAKKISQFEQTFEKVAQIAENNEDPDKWLRDALIVRGIDSTLAIKWSKFERGPVCNADDEILPIPFLNSRRLPDIGILLFPENGNYKTIDTLWDLTDESD